MKKFDFWFVYIWKGKTEDYIGCKQSWKAALREILSQLEHPIYSADIMKWIRKELDG